MIKNILEHKSIQLTKTSIPATRNYNRLKLDHLTHRHFAVFHHLANNDVKPPRKKSSTTSYQTMDRIWYASVNMTCYDS